MVGAVVVLVAVVVVGAAVFVVAAGASVVSTADGAFVPIELADGPATSSSGTAAPPPQAVPARSNASHTFMRTKPLFPNQATFERTEAKRSVRLFRHTELQMTTDLVRIPDETCVGGALGGTRTP